VTGAPLLSAHGDAIGDEARREFGARLRAHRELRGIPLGVIAETTKVKASFLEGLERGDLSRWPPGIFRRAFFRDYVIAIGLPLAHTTSEFIALFGGEEQHGPLRLAAEPADSSPLRVTMAGATRPLVTADYLLAATTDLVAVAVLSGVAAWVIGHEFRTTISFVAILYYALSTALLGRTASVWVLSRLRVHQLVLIREDEPSRSLADWLPEIFQFSSARSSPSPSSAPAPDLHSTTSA
jgi:hypothetical protein